MRITSLVENTSCKGIPVEHGLSFYLEMDNGKRILFDMGQDKLFAENAERLGVSIVDVDLAVISHGHYDHGGGLKSFLEINQKSKVYIHKDAFQPHYSLRESGLSYIGLDKSLLENERIELCNYSAQGIKPEKGISSNKDYIALSSDITLFANVHGSCCNPIGNKLLYGPKKGENDSFDHEQNLIVFEGEKSFLFAGCAHCGIVNIIKRATEIIGHSPTFVFAGMHLVKSGLSDTEENIFISHLGDLLKNYNSKYYTMHCTGSEQFEKLKKNLGEQIEYFACGDNITL